MRLIFAVPLLAAAVLFNSIELSSQSHREKFVGLGWLQGGPPPPPRRNTRISIKIKGFPKETKPPGSEGTSGNQNLPPGGQSAPTGPPGGSSRPENRPGSPKRPSDDSAQLSERRESFRLSSYKPYNPINEPGIYKANDRYFK